MFLHFPLAEMSSLTKSLMPLAILMGIVLGLQWIAKDLLGKKKGLNAKARGGRKKAKSAEALVSMLAAEIILAAAGVALKSWAIIALAVVCLAGTLVLLWVHRNSAKVKGKVGEMVVGKRLADGLPEAEYTVLNDVYLPLQEGGTTQIDHVVVSRFGVFVVETKNYTGWIFGDAAAKTWTQRIYRKKSTFQNPIRQNYAHVCAIADNLGIPKEYLRGVVAFTGDCEFKTGMPEGVVHSRDLAAHIRGFEEPLFDEKDKKAIVAVLKEWNASVSKDQRNAHVENLRRRHGGG